MKQLLQNLRTGKTSVEDVPTPKVHAGSILVRVEASLVSAGTERMLVDFAGKSLLGKARARPDFVKQVLDKARKEGIISTTKAAFNRLDQPMPLGYSTAGIIAAVGDGVTGVKVGERVACAGSHAVHAEYNLVPRNLFVKVPPVVDAESAAFTTLGAIALHGFRLAEPQVGEKIAIIGLGLLGLLTVRIALAAGCRVFGTDIDPERVKLGRSAGAHCVVRESAESAGRVFSAGRGFDAVLICADHPGNDAIKLAAELCRDRGKVISIGAVGLDLTRKQFYEKEISFQVSRSYGPGRYDPSFEEAGQDYPFGYVRWTETRNMAAFLDLLASGKIEVRSLITHRFAITDAPQAYQVITRKTTEPFLGVLLTYPHNPEADAARVLIPQTRSASPRSDVKVGVLGAGNYAQAVFLPVLQKTDSAQLAGIASASGSSARHAAGKFGFSFAAADEGEIIDDPGINTVVILTRHDEHARQAARALRAGKNVYCEKPLAIDRSGLDQVRKSMGSSTALLSVGFNRRFSPFALKTREFLTGSSEPMLINYRVNAGFLPLTHWTQDPKIGGGRIIGEGCHFVDLCTFFTGSLPASITAQALPDSGIYRQDNIQLTLTYPDGSIANISYLANGDKSIPKETYEVFSGGRVAWLDDYRELRLTAGGRVQKYRGNQDKGHQAAWTSFLKAIRTGGEPPIPYSEIWAVHLAVFAAVESLRYGQPVQL